MCGDDPFEPDPVEECVPAPVEVPGVDGVAEGGGEDPVLVGPLVTDDEALLGLSNSVTLECVSGEGGEGDGAAALGRLGFAGDQLPVDALEGPAHPEP